MIPRVFRFWLQMAKFREMFEDAGQSKNIVNNYRPVQPLNSRRVTTNIILPDTIGSAPPTAGFMLFTIAMTFISSLFN